MELQIIMVAPRAGNRRFPCDPSLNYVILLGNIINYLLLKYYILAYYEIISQLNHPRIESKGGVAGEP